MGWRLSASRSALALARDLLFLWLLDSSSGHWFADVCCSLGLFGFCSIRFRCLFYVLALVLFSWLAHIRGLVWLCFLLWLVLCVCPVWLLFGVCVVLLYVIHIDFVLLLGGF